jgi:hypothetical protein
VIAVADDLIADEALTTDIVRFGHRLRGRWYVGISRHVASCSCGGFDIEAPRGQHAAIAGEFAVHTSLIGDRSPGRTHLCAAPIGRCGCAYDVWLARQAEIS